MGKNPKHLAILNAVAEKAGYGKPLPEGVYRGICQNCGFGSYVAAVAEVSVSPKGKLKIHRIVAGSDPGHAENPGFLWVQQGEAIWSDASVPSGQSCHGDATAMHGVSARYPAYDAKLGRPLTLAQRIEQCRTERQRAVAFKAESDERLTIEAYVGTQSRGPPLLVDVGSPAQPFAEHGRQLFTTRMGQLNMSCANCHDGRMAQFPPPPRGRRRRPLREGRGGTVDPTPHCTVMSSTLAVSQQVIESNSNTVAQRDYAPDSLRRKLAVRNTDAGGPLD